MSFAKVFSAQTLLLRPHKIDIEVDTAKGLHSFSLVGLASKEVDEAKDRVGAAIKNSGFTSPKQRNQKIVVALAPADIKKEGPLFDLPIALAYLLATGEIKFDTKKKLFIGELALDGSLRPVKGVLAIVRFAAKNNFDEIYVPYDNAIEASQVDDIKIFAAKNLKEVIVHLNTLPAKDGEEKILMNPVSRSDFALENSDEIDIDFADIKGNETAKRGLEIAAAGGHNISMWGPPGTGKTMLAKAFRHILPELSRDEMLEVTGIHSVAGVLESGLITLPPFRSPHHTSSYVSLVGGGATPKPGEVTLAHKGVLFLDEFPEFERRVIDSLRQPLEENVIHISRAKGSAYFPANFILVAAMNPCPCGNFGSTEKECTCLPMTIMRYQKKISGPVVDRIDMWVEVSKVMHKKLMDSGKEEATEKVKSRVLNARNIQKKRFEKAGLKITTNSELGAKNLVALADMNNVAKNLLDVSSEKLGLSGRAYHRIVKLARTIADLGGSEEIKNEHVLEALQYRPKQLGSF